MNLSSFGSILSGVADVGTGIYNAFSDNRNYKYMKGVQKESWNREDNAVQRRATDLANAGLSKTLAAGSAASSSAPVNLKAPQAHLDAMQKMMNYKAMTQMDAQIDKTKADAQVSKLTAQRSQLENAIRSRDFDIIQGNQTGQRSDMNDYTSQFMNGLNTVLGNMFPGSKDSGASSTVKNVAGDIVHGAKKTATFVTGKEQSLGNTKPENKGKSYPQVTADAYRDQWINMKRSVNNRIQDAFTSSTGRMNY